MQLVCNKMYCVFVFLCVAVSIGTVHSAVGIQLPVEKPQEMRHLEGCYMPDLNRVLPYSKPFSPQDGKSCLQYLCQKDNITTIFTCGAISVDEGCAIIPGDKFLPYPDCCSRGTCNEIDHESLVR